MEVFEEVLEPLVQVPIPRGKHHVVPLDGEDSPPPKCSKQNLDCEYIHLLFCLSFFIFLDSSFLVFYFFSSCIFT
jgi:hypothetical protein